MLLGKGPIGRYAFTAKTNIIAAGVLSIAGLGATSLVLNGFIASALSSAGAGAASFTLNGFIASTLNSAGAGACAPVLHSFDGAVLSSVGIAGVNFQNTRIDNRVLSISGSASFGPLTYAFFLDAERACVHQNSNIFTVPPEPRVSFAQFDPNKHPDADYAYVAAENRIAVVLWENRVYQAGYEPRGPATPNRKRTC